MKQTVMKREEFLAWRRPEGASADFWVVECRVVGVGSVRRSAHRPNEIDAAVSQLGADRGFNDFTVAPMMMSKA